MMYRFQKKYSALEAADILQNLDDDFDEDFLSVSYLLNPYSCVMKVLGKLSVSQIVSQPIALLSVYKCLLFAFWIPIFVGVTETL